jgi:hypothetical protein
VGRERRGKGKREGRRKGGGRKGMGASDVIVIEKQIKILCIK